MYHARKLNYGFWNIISLSFVYTVVQQLTKMTACRMVPV